MKMGWMWTVFLAVLFPRCFLAPMNHSPVTVLIALTGQDRELRCLTEVSEGAEVLVLEWTRPSSGHYVLLYRDDRVHQHPMYKNRVQLREPDLSSGDLTILMKNISTDDSGTYKCEALIQTSDGDRKEHAQFFHLKPVKPIVAHSGEDRALPCTSPPGGAEVLDLQWTREGSVGHVLQYRDGRLRDEQQNHSFKDRVELQDPELRSGDMSISLKNISKADSGVYQCYFEIQTPDGPHKHSQFIQFIQLTVKPGTRRPGAAAQNSHGYWGVGAGVLLILVVVGIFVFICVRRRTNDQTDHTPVPSEDQGEESEKTQSSSAQTHHRSLTRFPRVRFSSLSNNGSAENVLLEPPTQPSKYEDDQAAKCPEL